MSLNHVLDQFLGGQSGNQPGNASGNPSGNLGLPAGLGNAVPGGLLGGLAAGGLLGVIAGNKKFRKKAGDLAGGAVALGGAAALGAVAYTAYRKWQGNGAGAAKVEQANGMPVQPLPPENFDPSNAVTPTGKPFQIALVEAMIAAAYADGHIDQAENKAIFEAVQKLPLETGEKAVIFDALQNPPDLETIAGYSSGIEQACELYLVSRLAIDPDHPAEKLYMERLAARFGLPSELVEKLEAEVTEAESIAA